MYNDELTDFSSMMDVPVAERVAQRQDRNAACATLFVGCVLQFISAIALVIICFQLTSMHASLWMQYVPPYMLISMCYILINTQNQDEQDAIHATTHIGNSTVLRATPCLHCCLASCPP